jgi:hypothetical protein
MAPHFRMTVPTVDNLGRPRVDWRSTSRASCVRTSQYAGCGRSTTPDAKKLRVMADVLPPRRSHCEELRACGTHWKDNQ